MPLIYLRHAIHGAKIATMEMEAEYDERNGWERYTPGVEDDSDDEPPPPPVNALGRRRRKEVQDGYHSG
jgi:hypothetical protein